MSTPIEILLSVIRLGGRLGIAGDKLRMLLPADCQTGLKDAIRQHKPALIQLLRLEFLVIRSDTLNALVLWTPDEETKESLIAAGAQSSSIYTAAELDQLVQRRVTAAELPLIHAARKQFNGRLTAP